MRTLRFELWPKQYNDGNGNTTLHRRIGTSIIVSVKKKKKNFAHHVFIKSIRWILRSSDSAVFPYIQHDSITAALTIGIWSREFDRKILR